jgi:hypothetical protein
VAEIPARPAQSMVDGEGRFIPAATQAMRKPLSQRQADARQADPLEDAALSNAGPRKTNQLLNWIVRSSKPAATAPAERIEPAMPAAKAPVAEAAPAPVPAPAPTMFEAAESRPVAQPSENDLIDIPAFLRRQAN